MKNRFRFFFISIVLIFSINLPLLSKELRFEAENIETIDKDLIIANNNIVVSDSNENKIYGNKLTIKDEKIYSISENVVFKNIDNSIILNTEKIIYNLDNSTIKTYGETSIQLENFYFFKTSDISYNLISEEIISEYASAFGQNIIL